MADESLVLRLEAYDRLSSKLRDVSRQFSEIATQAGVTAAAIAETESEADELGDELSSLNRDLATTTATLGATTAAFRALDGAIDDIDGDIDLDIPNLSDELGDTRKRFAVVANTEGVRQALAGLDSEDRTIDVDVNPVLSGFRDRLASIDPDDRTLSLGVETDDLAAAAVAIDRLKDRADSTRASLLTLDDTGVSIDLDVDDPRRSLTDLDTVDLPARFDTAFDIDETARDFSARLRSALPDEFDLDLDSRIDIGTDTDLAAIETVRASLASLPESVRSEIDVDADLGPAERAAATLRSLPNVSRRVDADAAFDVDTSTLSLATSLLDDLSDDQLAALDIETDADTSDIEHTRALLDSLAGRDTVAEVDTDADLDAISETHAALESLPESVRTRIEVDRDTSVTGSARTALDALADRGVSIPIDIDADFDTIAAVHAALDTLPDRVVSRVDVDSDLGRIERTATALRSLPDISREAGIDVDRPDTVDVGTTAGSVSPDIDTPDAGTVTPRAGTVAPDLTLPDGGTIRPDVDMPTPDAVEIPTDMDIRGTTQYLHTLSDRIEGFNERIDIGLGDSERQVLQGISEIRSALAALPGRHDTTIGTEADLDELVAALGGIEALPDEVQSEIDVDVDSADAHAALTAVLAQTKALDDLSVDADVDSDTSALSTLRAGDGFDLDLPDFEASRRDRRGAVGGATSVVAGGLKGAPGVGGAIRAFSGMGPAAILGGAGVIGGLASVVAGAVSAGLGTALGGGAIAGGLALPVAVNVDESEVEELKASVKAALAPLEGGAWEDLQQRLFAGVPQAAGMVAGAINSVQSELLGVADTVGDSFWTEFPSILGETTAAIRRLDDDISNIGVGTLEFLPGLFRESARAADVVLPILGGWMQALGPIFGTMSRIGTALFELLDAPVQAILDPLAAMAPLGDLIADAFSLVGQAMSFLYDNMGARLWGGLADVIAGTVDVVYWLADAIYSTLDSLGVIDWLADAVTGFGEAVGGFFDFLGEGAEWALEKAVSLYNTLNDIPGATTIPGVTKEDIEVPTFGGGEEGSEFRGGSGGGSPPGAGAAAITGSAVASLPSSTSTSGTTTSTTASSSSTATGTTAATAGGGGGGGDGGVTHIYRAPKFKAVIQNQGTFTRKDARKLYREMEQQDQKQTSPGIGG